MLAVFEAPALVRVGAFFIVWLLLWLPLAIPLAIALKWRPPQPISPTQKLPLLGSLYLLAPLLLWAITRLTNTSFADYGLPWRGETGRSLLLGLAVGVAGIAILFGIQAALGWVQWQSKGTWRDWGSTLLSTLALGLWVSVTEELIFRGFLLNELQQDYSLWLAGAIASLIFAVLHLVWEGKDNIPQLPGLWLMGMVLTLARWADGGSLGLAWGLHAGWIWAIATLDTLQVLHYTGRGSRWLVGFDNKPLAGLMGLLFLVGTGLAIVWGWTLGNGSFG